MLRKLMTLGTLAIACAAVPAHAGLFRAYLSVAGNDANACSVQAPCRLLPAALAAVNDGGEIWIMDSANFNTAPVSIGKSVTILAIPGAVGSVVASSGAALVISGSGVAVSLKNLRVLNFASGTSGIVYAGTGSSQLTVEECEIQGLPGYGIDASAGSNLELVVRDTALNDNGNTGVILAGPSTASFERIRVSGGGTGIYLRNGVHATVTDSVVTGNGSFGLIVESVDGSSTDVVFEGSVQRGSNYGALVNANGVSGSRARLVSRNSSALANVLAGFDVAATQNTSAFLVLDGNLIEHNSNGVVSFPQGNGVAVAQTLGNNTFQFNTNQDFELGTLTPLADQ
jgi:hypothetical protein